MGKSNLFKPSRRDFITKIVPACSLMCAGGIGVLDGILSEGETSIFQEKHTWDLEFPRKITFKDLWAVRTQHLIRLAQEIEKEFGKEKTIEILKRIATEDNLKRGQSEIKGAKDTSLKTYTRKFADPKEWEGLLNMKVVEDTETAFELKVAECVVAKVFHDAKVPDYGYAYICWGDYAWAEGFNSKIKLVRDKTLMEGDKYCNHRYIWTV